jgi:streptomycin 6-kinase
MFTQVQINNIMKEWGQEIYIKILREIEIYSKKWKLSDLSFCENYSMNAIVFCKSELYGEGVLKIGCGLQDSEFISEYNVLREYKGRRFVNVFESDIEADKKIMLLKRIFPGTELKEEESFNKRLSVFSELFNGLHIEPDNPALYLKYADKVKYFTDCVNKRTDCKDLHSYAAKAHDICQNISSVYNKEMLLHGDLHYRNILLRDNGKYAIIDPQGLIGNPVFDVPRYILIDYYHNGDKPLDKRADRINQIINYFEDSLNIPNKILRQCFYVESITMECWDATLLGEYNIDNAIFADTVINY